MLVLVPSDLAEQTPMTLLIDVDFAKEAVSEDIVNKFQSLIKHQIMEVDAQT